MADGEMRTSLPFVSCAKPGAGCIDPHTCASQRDQLFDPSWCLYRRDDLTFDTTGGASETLRPGPLLDRSDEVRLRRPDR